MRSWTMWTRPIFLVIACWLSGGAVSASAEVISQSILFKGPRGEYVTQPDRYHTFRIPGIVVAEDGTILAFAEGRRGDGDDPRIDEHAPADIVMRRSTDQGNSWEPLVVIESGFRQDGAFADFGDPTPILDASTGTVFLCYGQWADFGPRIPRHGQSTDPRSGHQTLWIRWTKDQGQTWSGRRQIVYPDAPADTSDELYWRYVEPGPGNGIQLRWQTDGSRNGRLLIPVKRAGSVTPDGPATVRPFVYYSDDHGATWHVGNIADGPQGNENEVVELTDGTVLMDVRQNTGNYRRRYRSLDGGVTWGPNKPDTIPLTPVDGSMVRYSATRAGHDRDRIFFSAPRGDGRPSRHHITIWTSYDEGQTFENPVQFNQGFAAYSVVARLNDGTIGLLVEADAESDEDYGSITFLRFDLAELESAR